jgi:hypothetical protein
MEAADVMEPRGASGQFVVLEMGETGKPTESSYDSKNRKPHGYGEMVYIV